MKWRSRFYLFLKKAVVAGLLLTPGLIVAQEFSDTTHRLHEVQISGKKKIASSSQAVEVVSGEKLNGSSGLILADVLKELPGISSLKSGGTIAKPVIHGLHSNRLLLLNNGVRLEGQQWGAEHAPELDPMLAERIEVIKSAASVRYGAEAMGGVILLQPRVLPVGAGLNGGINLTGISNGRGVTGSAMFTGGLSGLKGFGWRLQGTLKRSGNIHTADYMIGNTGLAERNYSAALGYTNKKARYELYYSHFGAIYGIMYTAHVATLEDIESRIAAGQPFEEYGFTYQINVPRQNIRHDLLKANFHYDFAPERTFDFTYAYQRNHRREFDLRRGNREALPINDLLLSTHTLDMMLGARNKAGSGASLGINGMLQINNNVPGTLANTFIPNYDSFSAAIFFARNWLTERAEYELGLRYDFKQFDAAGFRYAYGESDDITEQYYGGKRKFHNLTGTAGAVFRLGGMVRLISNIGAGWRAPSANELFSKGLHHGAGLFEVGDPGLQIEQGYKWTNGLSYVDMPLELRLDLYAQYIRNYIYTRPDKSFRQTMSGTFPVFRYRQTAAFFRGTDFSVIYRFTYGLTYMFNASLVIASDLNNGGYLPLIPGGKAGSRLRLELGQTRKVWKDFCLQLNHEYTFRQGRFLQGSDFAPPPPGYHLLGISVGNTIPIANHRLGLDITAENLFNRLYKDYMDRYRYFVHGQGRNLMLRLNYRF
ncbi:TonB-dependent receptor [Pedobacter sp. JY14-1]|uniref:TonB-dependent receptor n=1 Tax=Pedobacter sp. JY14-1 TaxID=3034151 RepID=UPI0023E0F04E|nr:TonB-dependent receptor [Pedobacter sp. JY14-1]